MEHLELTHSEKQCLIEALESYLSDLRMEIAGTDRMDFRSNLKSQKESLMGILMKLQVESQSQSGTYR